MNVLDRLDPRTRILAACGLAISLALSSSLPVLGVAVVLGAALSLCVLTGRHRLLRRWLFVNTFLVLMSAPLLFSTEGTIVGHLGPIAIAGPGFDRAMLIVLKGNSIFLLSSTLLCSLDAMAMAKALQQLGLPAKLTQLIFLTVRYSGVMKAEYQTLRQAMRARGFRLRPDAHGLRTVGYLVGNLLARSFDRSQRILDAMKCRGFQGTFHVLQPVRFRTGDRLAIGTTALLVLVITWAQLG